MPKASRDRSLGTFGKEMKLPVMLLTVLLLASCATRERTSLPKNPYEGVSITDGVSRKEAGRIVENYGLMFIGCGGLTGVTDRDNKWEVNGYFGYAGTPVKGTYIDKASGKIVSTIGPSFDPEKNNE